MSDTVNIIKMVDGKPVLVETVSTLPTYRQAKEVTE